MHLKGSASEKR
ncbi:Protein of unknown function [Bacillus mycoides]|nr:Protein of unknown function [Bacillus mycoides]